MGHQITTTADTNSIDHSRTSAITWSLITVTYNSGSDLARYWNVQLPKDVEWIVIDNASTDDSAQMALARGGSVITLPDNIGFAGACNVGLEKANGQYVAFVNPDVSVDLDTLARLGEILSSHEAILGPQLIYPDGTPQPNGRGLPTLWNKVLNRMTGTNRESDYYKFALPGEVKEVLWLTGAAVCGRRETFLKIGGWDSSFFLYYEDIDLCFRARERGFPIKVVGDAQWIHRWERATAKIGLGPWKQEFRSVTRFYGRYPWLFLPARLRTRWLPALEK